jgi:DNA-binding beta-propeller fold protein YncE
MAMRRFLVLGAVSLAALCASTLLVAVPRSAPLLARAADRLSSSALAPQVTVVVENRLPIHPATGIAINEAGTVTWVTEEVENEGRLVQLNLATGLDIPVDVAVDAAEQYAYVARERGPARGVNVVSRVRVSAGQMFTVTDTVGQPVDISWLPGQTAVHVADLAGGQVHRVGVPGGAADTRLTGLTKPFGLALAADAVTAYLVTEPAPPTSAVSTWCWWATRR